MRSIVNEALDPAAVAAATGDALTFHRGLPGYEPTPLRELPHLATELGLAAVLVKDESTRLGLPAFKILGASWAVEQALRREPGAHALVAASAGNHGRAVARVAAMRGLGCVVHLPSRSLAVRREAIAAEGADLVVDGTYEDAVGRAARAAERPGVLLIADVGEQGPAIWVVEGYATLFTEAAAQAGFDLVLVPVGVGSLAAAAVRHAAPRGIPVIGVEPATAACLTESIAAGAPTRTPGPGTAMAGLDCAEVSPAAWPSLRAGVSGTVTVDDAEADAAAADLADLGLEIGECGAAPLAALRALAGDPRCEALRARVGLGPRSRVLLIATEGRTGRP